MIKQTWFMLLLCIVLTGCGYSSKNNESVGQVKKVVHQTPILCSDYIMTNISLGVMKNGVGSMSTEDKWLVVKDSSVEKLLSQASADGSLIKFKYDSRRLFSIPAFGICENSGSIITSVEIIK